MVSSRSILTALAVAVPASLAQTYTECNPMEKSCPADPALESSSFTSTWTGASSLGKGWTTTAGQIGFGDSGAQFTINKAGDAPTIQSDFYFFFGTLEVKMKASPGTGIVSSIVLLSDTLDEVDWEFVGGDPTQTQTNYFGKGNTTTYDRAVWYPVSSPQTTEHTYTINWTADSITWAIDGTVVRTLTYGAANGGYDFPQTPMRVRLGSWAGGAPGNPQGTIQWAGGQTDFSKAPFTMSISSVKVTNYSPGSQYVYTDNSGSYKSVKVVNGASGGVFAPSQAASSVPLSSTTQAGTTVVQSSTSVASSISASTVSTGAALTTIPLQVSSLPAPSSSATPANSTLTSKVESVTTGANGPSTLTSTYVATFRPSGSVTPSAASNGTTNTAGPRPTLSTGAAVALGASGSAAAGLFCFVAAALVLL